MPNGSLFVRLRTVKLSHSIGSDSGATTILAISSEKSGDSREVGKLLIYFTRRYTTIGKTP